VKDYAVLQHDPPFFFLNIFNDYGAEV
jgi:hypothetical protein